MIRVSNPFFPKHFPELFIVVSSVLLWKQAVWLANIQNDGKFDCTENVQYWPVELQFQQGNEDGGLGGPVITSYFKDTYRNDL